MGHQEGTREVPKKALRLQKGVGGAQLGLLVSELHRVAPKGLLHLLPSVAHHHHEALRLKGQSRLHRVEEHGPPQKGVEHLGRRDRILVPCPAARITWACIGLS